LFVCAEKIRRYYSFFGVANNPCSQISTTDSLPVVTDTTAYLQDSIIAKRNYYIGKQLQVLFNNLWLPIKEYSGEVPLPSYPDTIKVRRFVLYFYEMPMVISKMLNHQKLLSIEVTFASPILIPKSYFKRGGLLDAAKGWTSEKANFYGSYIISDLKVLGYEGKDFCEKGGETNSMIVRQYVPLFFCVCNNHILTPQTSPKTHSSCGLILQ
jgi:hypothetical protein